MDFAILGPVQVADAGRPIRLAAKARALLGVFLLHPNTVLTRDRLIASVWDDPPRSALPNLQTYLTALRRAAIDVETVPHGYRLSLGPDRLDVLAFEEAVREARLEAARGEPATANRLFAQALALWRGRPAEDVTLAATVQARIAELEERRESARLGWIDVRLRLGLYDELVGELTPLVEATPLNERLWHRLMLALHRAGRRAEALEAYQRARSVLVAELAVEPSQELRDLHAAVLDDAPVPAPALEAAREPAWTGICLLPADIADFVGRETETRDLVAALDGGRAAPAIVTVSGPPGVGKSTLAVHVAHLVRERYPDGQLFVRLHDASASPRDPSDLLAELLRALGVDSAGVPSSTEERAAMYRARIADRAVLVLLDDAAGEAQVQPLIPGTPRSAVLLTSRGPLSAMPGAITYALDVPPPADAHDLLAGVAGASRVASDPESAEAILRACGRLPLALRIAGARLVARPAWPLAELARRLADASALNELHAGHLDVRATFEASYATLSAPARRAFRLLGSVAADGVAAWMVAALADATAYDVDGSLEELAVAGLITAGEADAAARPRYRMHDLLRGFAAELFLAEESRECRTAALRRVATEARARAADAARELPLAFAPPPPGVTARTPPCPEGGAWLAAERGVLVTVAETAAHCGLVQEAAELAYALAPFLVVRGFHDDAVRMLGAAAGAAAAAGDTVAETRLRLVRADAEVDRRRASAVADEFRHLLSRCSQAGDRHAAAYALLGVAATLEADLGSALAAATLAAERFHALGDGHGLLSAWTEIAGVQFYLGRYNAAGTTCRRALAHLEDDSAGSSAIHRARFLRALGIACYETGRVEEAIGHYRASLDLCRELRWSSGERLALHRQAQAEAALGRHDTATGMLAHCAEMFVNAGDTRGQALIAYTLGEISRWRGDERAALAHFTTCLDRLDPLNEHVWSARAREQIARSRAALS
ncbi:AfsR/SARP family transcriptional regulator [Nonomuraea cavernae]|uniref:SARP family transcriptional regulator n=1 Tax=Nonomuraea cavernae TaxID=2045107 RepID=A0A917YP76_9ACTN|nr:BTAD domain-containing putative transcriptional regulator [Nonomuraea cavernae]MCA2184219.1 tetratricopeptide repeat protein [Nonomuraea cavernae]GGO62674.1 SARP family transcriptional regulator [Nonomuraea cavernae]